MLNRFNKRTFVCLMAAFMVLSMLACATGEKKKDPLKNTKKLVKEGHGSLYHNGAFKVPKTSIRLIPPAPDTISLAKEMAGVRARESFLHSLEKAAESVQIVRAGTEFSHRTAKNIDENARKGADEVRRITRGGGTAIISGSSALGMSIAGNSWQLSKKTLKEMKGIQDNTIKGSRFLGNAIDEGGTKAGTTLASGSLSTAKRLSSGSLKRSSSALSSGANRFVQGYAAVPGRVKSRVNELGDNISEAPFADVVKEENERRGRMSRVATDIIGEMVRNYRNDVGASFDRGKEEFRETYQTTGLSFATLKYLRWVLQGVLWDATLEPAAKISVASVGYIGVNAVVFPTMVVIREGVATTEIAVEVVWDSTATAYDIIAPSATAAVAGLYSLVDFTGSHVAAGTAATAGPVLGYGMAGMSKAAGVTIKGSGYAAAGAEYVGVPLVAAGVAVGGGTIGTAVGGAGMATGGAVVLTGEALSVTTKVAGKAASGTTLVGGTVVSAASGGAYGIYQLSKAVVVPAGYEIGSGIVLSYGTIAHMGAHSVLAVSDCAYMVLSLEGPRWVVYAVKGNLDDGEDLPVGTMLDLEKMQEAGEEIYYVPLSEEEMKKVVDSVYENLPEMGPESTGNDE